VIFFGRILSMAKMMLAGVVLGGLVLGGCYGTHALDQRYVSERPEYGDKALPNPGEAPPAERLEMVNPDPVRRGTPEIQEVVTGTWTFVTPTTTTRVERKTEGMSQFSLYMGRPKPTDTPVVVITVSADPRTQVESDPETYKVTGTRSYVLNGNIAKEWTGTTKDGAAFTELLVTKPGGKGDVCHAVAVAKTGEERKVALEILGSLTWKANEKTE